MKISSVLKGVLITAAVFAGISYSSIAEANFEGPPAVSMKGQDAGNLIWVNAAKYYRARASRNVVRQAVLLGNQRGQAICRVQDPKNSGRYAVGWYDLYSYAGRGRIEGCVINGSTSNKMGFDAEGVIPFEEKGVELLIFK
uniref:Uncharacterized protein n=1 Tax=Magnetococcus massalia (strain MO-1) TaxID=451514 RepID=A0A1S7LFR7_MAGMO|nr:Exported protein of unknown function [Candidatus Magnetococcus massalia]